MCITVERGKMPTSANANEPHTGNTEETEKTVDIGMTESTAVNGNAEYPENTAET